MEMCSVSKTEDVDYGEADLARDQSLDAMTLQCECEEVERVRREEHLCWRDDMAGHSTVETAYLAVLGREQGSDKAIPPPHACEYLTRCCRSSQRSFLQVACKDC